MLRPVSADWAAQAPPFATKLPVLQKRGARAACPRRGPLPRNSAPDGDLAVGHGTTNPLLQRFPPWADRVVLERPNTTSSWRPITIETRPIPGTMETTQR